MTSRIATGQQSISSHAPGDIAGRLLKQTKEHDVPGLAAELAYRSALAVLPFLLMLAALPSVAGSVLGIDSVGDRLTREAEALLSENSAEMMRTLVDEVGRSQGWTPFLVGVSGTIWAGTLTTSALRKSLNRIYGFDEGMPFLQRKLIDLGHHCLRRAVFHRDHGPANRSEAAWR